MANAKELICKMRGGCRWVKIKDSNRPEGYSFRCKVCGKITYTLSSNTPYEEEK